ncbi:ATPase family protein 2 homolog isoform X2 [Homarus americanus]|uniref:ATPase family protein 2 homolog isoform X2 n=1 Tax=Homarus americanus TaxID=6706 RepID=UPI001C4542A6|nr:ATPase family protein 2 homolog isoform X2 [Homarus americanus]
MDTHKSASPNEARPKKSKNRNNSPSKISAKLIFTSLEALHAKTQAKLRIIRPLSVVMLPVVATKRGFDGQFVTFTTKNCIYPALLVLDKHLKENVSIITESITPEQNLSEGEEVTLCSDCPKLYAEEVSFCLLSNKELNGSIAFTLFLKEQLVVKGLIICTGMNIFVNYLSQEVILRVHNVRFSAIQETQFPQIPFQCIWQTRVITQGVTESNIKHIKQQIKFEDIGGYQHEFRDLLHQIDMLFSPITSGVKPVKGILISGPSGCGKSLIGEALKTKFGNKCVNIQLEDIKSKFRGETEQNLKQCFVKAFNRVPCLVFIDDLDILCSSRDRNGDTGIVTSLLHLMDGLGTTSDGILVIATASKPQTLDAALRRPGRLSHDVVLSLPDEFARREILQKLLFGVSNDLEESKLTTLAVNAHGYVGGDLQSVVMESVMQTQGRKLTIQDLEASVATTKPAALRESTLSEFEVKLPDICGYDRIKSKLHEALSLTLAHGSVFHKCGITPPSRFLLFGPPGCGKSSIIKALATDFHLRIIPVKRSTVLGKYFGESEQNLARIFLKANDSSPCIIHFENFDGLAGKKKLGEHGGTDVESRIINHLKVQLDGIVQNDGIFIFAETNRPDLLNKDVIRPGRFHEYYFVDLPKPEDRRLILGKHLLPSKVAEAVELDNLIQQTTFFTAAELVHLCEEVKTQSKRESIWNVDDPDYTINSGRCSEEILESLIPNTSQKMLHKYKAFAKIYCS